MSAILRLNDACEPMVQQVEAFPGHQVTSDIALLIFRFLPPDQIPGICSVCKSWNQLASSVIFWKAYHLKELFPEATFIDKGVWEERVDANAVKRLNFNEKGRPCLDKSLYLELKRLRIEGDAGITFLTIPEGLTFNILSSIAGDFTKSEPFSFSYICPLFLEKYGDDAVTKTHTIAITNAILKKSAGLSHLEKEKLASQPGQELGVLEVATLCVLTSKVASKKPPFNRYHLYRDSYTFCAERVNGCILGLRIGPGGLCVCDPRMDDGVGALRKLGIHSTDLEQGDVPILSQKGNIY
jgi:hypothetical protein